MIVRTIGGRDRVSGGGPEGRIRAKERIGLRWSHSAVPEMPYCAHMVHSCGPE
jgi:hypothetical protein